MKQQIALFAAALALVAFPVVAGEWHSSDSGTNLCTDCHTMHFSQTHNWDGTTPVPTAPAPNGNWLGATGPNNYLLKLPVNELCLSCHDGQTFAPDVLEANTNSGAHTQGRSAGALNHSNASPYEAWKGHTLDTTATPPGYNPTVVGLAATWYTPANGLECISCHTQHGRGASYRNLGPRSLTGPTYKFSTTAFNFANPCRNDSTSSTVPCDVRIDLDSYTANSGVPATMAPYYDTENVFYGRNDALVINSTATGINDASNRMDVHCAACHGDFHGGPGDTNIGPDTWTSTGFIRHPTSEVRVGTTGSGHSTLTRFTDPSMNTTPVKTYYSAVWDSGDPNTDGPAPGCVTCHKAHGNQNPFGLVFLNRKAAAVTEQGGWSGTEIAQDVTQGYRNLCGQCHGQGN